MNVEVNWLAVLLAGISSMIVGTLWYGPVFGEMWKKLVKQDPKKMKAGAVPAMITAFVLSLLMAYVLAHVAFLAHQFFKNSFMQDAVSTAFWVWLGFAFSRTVTHDAFEGRRKKLTLLNVGNQLVTLLVMGVIIGWLHP